MAQLEDLPDEILTMIMDAMCRSPCGQLSKETRRTAVRPFSRALARLASTNRRFHCIATPLLYHSVMFAQFDVTSLPSFCRTILTRPEKAGLVRAFDFAQTENRACLPDGAEIDETAWMKYDEEEDGEEEDIDYIEYRGWGHATSNEKRMMQDYIRQTFTDETQRAVWTVRTVDRQLLPALLCLTVGRMENLSDLTIRDGRTVFWTMFQEFLDAFGSDHDRSSAPFRKLSSVTATGLDAQPLQGLCFQSLALFLDVSTDSQIFALDNYGRDNDEWEEYLDDRKDNRLSGSSLSTLQQLFGWIKEHDLWLPGGGMFGNDLPGIVDRRRQLECVELDATGDRSPTAAVEGRVKMEVFARHQDYLSSLTLLSTQPEFGNFSVDFSKLCRLRSLNVSLDWLYEYNLDGEPTQGEWLAQILPHSIQTLWLRLRHRRGEIKWLSGALICLLQTKNALHPDLRKISCTVDHDWRIMYPEATSKIARQLSAIHALAWSKEVQMTGPV